MTRLLHAVLLPLLVSSLIPAAPAVASVDLQASIDAAPSGAVVSVPAGVHPGPIRIDKPLTLRGEDGAVIDGNGTGTVVTIESNAVTVQGLVIRNSGSTNDREDSGITATGSGIVIEDNRLENVLFGVLLRQSPDAVVRGNWIGAQDLEQGRRGDGIKVWESNGVLLESNVIDGGRDLVLWYSDGLVIRDNTVTNGRYGLHFMYSDDVTVDSNRLVDNSVGAFLMYGARLVFTGNHLESNNGPSGYGLGLKDVDGAAIHDNTFVENRIGIYIDNSPVSPDVEQHFSGNVFAYNDIGIALLPSVRRNVFWENAFVDNREQVARQGDGVLRDNIWTVDGTGNYWSDYAGFDADDDGKGDIAYRIDDLFAQVTDQRPDLRLLSGTPAARVVDAAAKAFPTMKPEPKVIDDAPLIAPPMNSAGDGHKTAIPLLLTGLGLLAATVVAWLSARRRRLPWVAP